VSLNVRGAIAGVNWITMVGAQALEALKVDDMIAQLQPGTTAIRASHGLVVCAGEAPTLGDLNRDDYPRTIAAVDRALAPLRPKAAPQYRGLFFEKGQTQKWMNRFADPQGWA
jgi:hypothetical protein